jgi:hypothetical protein
MAERHLVEAKQTVALGLEHIARQEQIIARLTEGGRDRAAAEELLRTLRECQALHEAHRDRLRVELGRGERSVRYAL